MAWRSLSRAARIGIIAATTYAIVLHLLIAAVILRPYKLTQALAALHAAGGGWQPSEYWSTLVVMQARVDTLADGEVLVIGDSLIQSMNVSLLAPDAVNYGIGGDTVDGVLHRLPYYHSLPSARAVVLSIGSNDLDRADAGATAMLYQQLVALIPPSVPLVASAVIPVDERALHRPVARSNREIGQLNLAIAAICARRPRCVYVDVGAQLVDGTGELRADFHVGDGLHLTAPAYRIWQAALKDALAAATESHPAAAR